ncbi:hypothetical protein SNEBB_009892 [Seison nebaliae]|nr:hypothetical protein SNEBB_009892 [Seison nebaliae]
MSQSNPNSMTVVNSSNMNGGARQKVMMQLHNTLNMVNDVMKNEQFRQYRQKFLQQILVTVSQNRELVTIMLRMCSANKSNLLINVIRDAVDNYSSLESYNLQTYIQKYNEYLKFFEQADDAVRPELSQVLFPLFVTVIMQLLQQNRYEDAAEFYKQFSKCIPVYYDEYLLQLKMLRTFPPSPDSFPLLNAHMTQQKYHIRQSILGEQCLSQWFLKNHYSIFLERFKSQIEFIRCYEQPPSAQILYSLSGAFFGIPVYADNKIKVFNSTVKEQNFRARIDGAPSTAVKEDHEMTTTAKAKKRSINRPTSTENKSDKTETQATTTTTTVSGTKKSKTENILSGDRRLPFPPIRSVDQILKANEGKEEKHLPSVKFFTHFESDDRITCADFSLEGGEIKRIVMLGFNSAIIRVIALEGKLTTLSNTDKSFRDLSSLFIPNEHDNKDKKSHLLVGHSAAVTGVSISSDRLYSVSSSLDCTVRLWCLTTMENLAIFRAHSAPVLCVKFSPFSFYFASGGQDRSLMLWDMTNHLPIRIMNEHLSDVECLSWHPNSHYVATGSSDRMVRVFEITTAQVVRMYTGHKSPITSVQFSHNGKLIASGGAFPLPVIIINSFSLGVQLVVYGMHQNDITSLDFSFDSHYLVSGSIDQTIKVWDVTDWLKADSNDDVAQIIAANEQSSNDHLSSSVVQSSSLTNFSRQYKNDQFGESFDISTLHDVTSKLTKGTVFNENGEPQQLEEAANLIMTLYTKNTDVINVTCCRKHLVLAVGTFDRTA